MAKFRIIDALPITVQSGSQTFGPANVTNGTSSITVRLARCTTARPSLWPDANTIIDCQAEVSTDGGSTYKPNNGFGAAGGIFLNRDGSESTETTFTCGLPPGNNRKVRLKVTVTNGPLVSELSTDVE